MCKNTLFRRCFVKPLITVYFLTWKNTSTFLQPTLHCLFFLSNKTRVWFLTSTFVKSAGSCDSGVQVWIKIFTYCERAFMTKSVSSKMPRDFFLSCVSIVFVTSELEQSNREAKMKVPFPLKLLTNTSSGCGFSGSAPEKKSRLFEPACSWTTRHYCGGIWCREPPGWTSLGGVQGRILTRWPRLLNWFLWMWRTSGSSPRTKLLTLRESLITLRRKLVLADCIRDLMPSVVPQNSWPKVRVGR